MTVNIAFATDNNYLPYLSVAIQSIIENCNKNLRYNIFIFHGTISKLNEEMLKNNIPQNFNIEMVNVAEKFVSRKLFYGNASIEAYYRLYIPYYLTNVDKVLYLDCDLICNDDISDLFKIPIDGFSIGAVKGVSEIGGFLNSKTHYWNNILTLENPLNYFNSGVMLIDNKQFREKISFDNLCNFAETQNWPCYDQDVLNQLFQNDVKFLPNEWNFIKHHNAVFAPEVLIEIYNKTEKKPKIIHFASGYKPWSKKYYLPFSYDFWKYATRCNFSDTIINEMNIKYTCYTNENFDVNTLPIFSLIFVIFKRIRNKIIKKIKL